MTRMKEPTEQTAPVKTDAAAALDNSSSDATAETQERRAKTASSEIVMPDDVDSFVRSASRSLAIVGGPVMDVILKIINRRPR